MKKSLNNTQNETVAMHDEAERDAAKAKKKRREVLDGVNRFFDRIAGFIIVFVLVIGFSLLIFDYMCIKGPSPTFQEFWLRTLSETRRFGFINNLYLSQGELDEIGIDRKGTLDNEVMVPTFDSSLIAISEEKTDINGMDAYGLVDDDNDGIIFVNINYKGAAGYMIVVLDPSRVFLGCANGPQDRYGYGMILDDMVAKYGARGGINAGIFVDDNGAGAGWPPSGITISLGEVYEPDANGSVCGISSDGILYVGDYDLDLCVNQFHLENACSFGPILIANGQKMSDEMLSSGLNPRTVIGQRGDGAILLLAVDGRQAYSQGLTYGDCADLLLDYGCINAMNMDGGNSTSMYMDGKLINHPSNQAGGTRNLPTAWLFK